MALVSAAGAMQNPSTSSKPRELKHQTPKAAGIGEGWRARGFGKGVLAAIASIGFHRLP